MVLVCSYDCKSIPVFNTKAVKWQTLSAFSLSRKVILIKNPARRQGEVNTYSFAGLSADSETASLGAVHQIVLFFGEFCPADFLSFFGFCEIFFVGAGPDV